MRYLTLIMLVFSTTVSASTYYVANSASVNGKYFVSNANNANNGTSVSTPWRTIGYATNQLGAGDTLFIMGGWWQERNAISGTQEMSTPNHSCIFLRVSGTAGNEIVIKSYIGGSCTERAVITGRDPNNSNRPIMTGFAAEMRSYIVIDSLIIQDCGKGGVLIFGCDYITVKNCVIRDIYTLTGGFDELNTAGIYFNGMSPYTGDYANEYCTFINDTIYNIRNAAGNIGDHTNTNPMTGRGLMHSIIRGNYLYGGYHGIRLKTVNKYNTVDSNIIFDIGGGEGIVLGEGAHANHVMFNVIWSGTGQNGAGTGGIGFARSYEGRCDSNVVYNNTFWGQDWGGRAGAAFGDWQESQIGGIRDNLLFNNIFYDFTTGGGNCCPAYSLYFERTALSGNTQEYIDYNCYYDPDHADVVRNVSTAYTLAEWRAASPYDDNSVRVDPQFLSLTSGNANFLRLDPASSPAALLTGGRGGSWPTYMGAFDPDVVVPLDTNCSDIVLVGPPNDTIFRVTSDQTNLVRLTWRSLTGTGYHLQIDENSGFSSPTIDTIISDTFFLAGGYGAAHLADSTGTTHYWHVQVVSGDCDASFPANSQRFILIDETSPDWQIE